jgi:metal-dependent amidase/aminoacylase/carboxypeptidase family protein
LICDAAALKHQTTVKFVLVSGVKRVYNDPILEEITRNALIKVCAMVDTSMNLGGEDFSNWSDARPSSYFLIGASNFENPDRNNNPCPHHSAVFSFDERALLVGIKAWMSLINEF